MPVCLETIDESPTAGAVLSKPETRRTVMQVTWSLVAGGAEMYAFTIAANLNSARYRSIMCPIDQGGALEPEVRNSGIPFTVMHRRQGIDWRLMWRMFKLFRENKVSIVQTHHFNQLFYTAIAAKLCGADIVHTEHSVELYKQRRYRIALRLLSHLCRSVIAIGSDGARVLAEQVGIPRRKMHVIRAGVDIDRFKEPRESARAALGLGESDKVVSIIARLYPEKNHLLLLRAFKEVVTKNGTGGAPESTLSSIRECENSPDLKSTEGDKARELRDGLPYTALNNPLRYRLLIVGEGIERQRIADEITELGLEDSVSMLGVRRDVATILAASDVFVLSSNREGLPIAVLEAMAAAVPVVATEVGDLTAIVCNGVTGTLVPPGDKEALSNAISELLGDPQQAAEMGRRGRDLIASGYGLQAMVAEYEKLLT